MDCNGRFKFALVLKLFRLSTNDLVSSTFESVTIKLNMFWSSVPSAAVGRRPKEMVRNSRATLGQCILKIWSSVCLQARTKQKTKIFNFIASKCYHIHHHLYIIKIFIRIICVSHVLPSPGQLPVPLKPSTNGLHVQEQPVLPGVKVDEGQGLGHRSAEVPSFHSNF